MEYADGVLQKSTRSGKANVEKVYKTINNEKIVEKTVNGVTTECNITKTKHVAETAQEKLKNLLKDDKLSSDELKKQADAIKFKSNNQKKEIENAINNKMKAEAEAKAKAAADMKAAEEAKKAGKVAKETVNKEAESIAKKAESTTQKTTEKATEAEVAKKATQEVVKFSGNPDERIAAIKNNKDLEYVSEYCTPEGLEAIKKFNPEILEQISDDRLAWIAAFGDVEKIATTLNGVSKETLSALNGIGISIDTIAGGLSAAGKKPTAEGITASFVSKGRIIKENKINETLAKKTKQYESQFKRVKLLDKIFTPDGIRNLKGSQKSNLKIWLEGDMAEYVLGQKDKAFFNSFWTALKNEATTKDGVNIDYILKVAEKL